MDIFKNSNIINYNLKVAFVALNKAKKIHSKKPNSLEAKSDLKIAQKEFDRSLAQAQKFLKECNIAIQSVHSVLNQGDVEP